MIYLFSNVGCTKDIGYVPPDSEFVFMNTAVNYELFEKKQVKKVLFSRETIECEDGSYLKSIDTDKVISERRYCTRPEWYGREKEIFDDFDVVLNLDHHFGTHFYPLFQYPFRKWATTGFILYSFFRYLKQEVTLVNFAPQKGPWRSHWSGHDWEYEQSVYDRDHARIIDLR